MTQTKMSDVSVGQETVKGGVLSVASNAIAPTEARDAAESSQLQAYGVMCLNEIGERALCIGLLHGFYGGDPIKQIPTKLALIHSEVSEALEAYRHEADLATNRVGERGKPEGFPSELADIVIRTCSLARWLGIDLDAAVTEKQDYNATRPYRHGGKRV